MKREDYMLANSRRDGSESVFTKCVMAKIEHAPNARSRWLLFARSPRLSFAAVVLLMMILFSGVTYAVTQLVKIIPTGINTTGHESFTVEDARNCFGPQLNPNKFEVVKGAPKLDADEIMKIIQAKCEMNLAQELPDKQWPSYSTHQPTQEGDEILYTRLDKLGTLKELSSESITINDGVGPATSYNTFEHKSPVVFSVNPDGNKSLLKTGDTVYSVVRVSEKYHQDLTKNNDQPQPKVLGLVAVIKMSFSVDYYTTKQAYITELPSCNGNLEELCPNTPSIDVYPRAGGEGSENPYLKKADNLVVKMIAGKVTAISENNLVLRAFAGGKEYSVTLSEPGFQQYNTLYAGNYTDVDAYLKIGNSVSVTYYERSDVSSVSIRGDQVFTVKLMLEGISPKASVNKY